MFRFLKKNKLTSTESVDIIENIVYEFLKPYGFKKHGHTLHRFVDGDISQVVEFQNGEPAKRIFDILWVNLGIRIPECTERSFCVSEPQKKFYHEYECNIRTRLGELADGIDTHYTLKKDPKKIGDDIVSRLEKFVLPIFETLNSRIAILQRRKDFPSFDGTNAHLILLEEAMIYGRSGDLKKAEQRFSEYYQTALSEYKHTLERGAKIYLKKGKSVCYRSTKTNKTETITASKSGFYVLFDANRAHLDYLEKLAEELGLTLCTHPTEKED